jgi:cytochrome P450
VTPPLEVSRYDDVSRLLRSRALSSGQIGGDPGAPVAELAENGRHLMLTADPPDHARRRGAVAPRFTSQPVEALQPVVEQHVARRLDEVEAVLGASGTVDLVPAFCQRIPMDTLCSLLGLPLADEARLRRWTTDLVDGIDPWAGRDAAERAGRAIAEVCGYLAPMLDDRRRHPAGDLLTTLATAADLTPDEQLHNAVLFLNAGLDTSGDLLANAIGLLLETPGAWAELVADPHGMAGPATEEAARLDSPVQVAMRRTIEPVAVGESHIPAGQAVLLLLGAANRDPAVFDQPDRFDLHRTGPRHLAFGGGPHHCLGAPVARVEVTTALRMLAARFPSLQLAGAAPWRERRAFRGRAALPVRVDLVQ